MKLVPDGWRWPRLISHLFDHESTTVTLGLWMFIFASCNSVMHPLTWTADVWLWATGLASLLVGGVRLGKEVLAGLALKFGKTMPPEPPPAAAPKPEVAS